MVEKAYGNKAKDQRVRSAPEPEILVQSVKSGDRDDKQDSFHYRFSGRANHLCLTDPPTGYLVVNMWSVRIYRSVEKRLSGPCCYRENQFHNLRSENVQVFPTTRVSW